MDVWNPGKNRWRYKEGSDEKIIEIELTKGQIALIDAERLPEILQHRWHAKQEQPPYQDTYYAYTAKYMGVDAKPMIKHTSMHTFLFPEIPAPRDHIDRNGLNNTNANIRNGANGINERNIRSGGRDIGIGTDNINKSYRASWIEANGLKKHKDFRWGHYPSKEESYAAAVAHREENAKRIMDELIEAQKTGQKFERHKPIPLSSNTGQKNICMQYKDGNPYRVMACIQIDGKRNMKNFSAFQYGGDINKAIEAANVWIKTLKQPKNQLKRKIDDE